MTAKICECLDPQSDHRASKYGCSGLDCTCTKFRFDIGATQRAEKRALAAAAEALATVALPVIEIQPEPVADDGVPEEPRVLNAAERGPQPIPPGWSPDGASTLARLAEAERETSEVRELLDGVLQERDQARAALADVEGERKVGEQRLTAAEREREDLRQGRDEAVERALALAAELGTARQEVLAVRGLLEVYAKEDAARSGEGSVAVPVPDVDLEGRLGEARAELAVLRESLKGSASTANVALRDLAEARTEVDNLRLSRDAAESQRAEARQVIEAMEEDRPTTVAPTGNVIDTYTRWFCQPITGCGGQYEIEQDDNYCACGKQLLAITVTAAITHH